MKLQACAAAVALMIGSSYSIAADEAAFPFDWHTSSAAQAVLAFEGTNLVIALDWISGGVGDGLADLAVVFRATEPLPPGLPSSVPLVNVELGQRTLRMTSREPGLDLELSVDEDVPSSEGRSATVRLRGDALMYYGLDKVRIEEVPGQVLAAARIDQPLAPSRCTEECSAGGEGSSTCSVSCAASNCSAGCRSPYHACCWCDPATGRNYCMCCQVQ